MMDPNQHEHFENLVLFAVLGALGDEERNDLDRHIASGCKECARTSQQFDSFPRLMIAPLAPTDAAREGLKAAMRTAPADDHAQWDELISLAALGALTDEDRSRLDAHHADDCTACSITTHELSRASDMIAESVTPIAPSAAVTNAVKRAVRAEVVAVPSGSVRDDIADTSSPSPRCEIVGRGDERRTLEALLDRLRKGDGAFVSIVGEPGVGKSRLVDELRRLADERGIGILSGHCASDARTRGYAAFIDLIRDWADIDEESDENTRRARLHSFVTALCNDRADEIHAAIARLMGIDSGQAPAGAATATPTAQAISGLSGQALERKIHESTRFLLKQGAGAQPLIAIFEDLHWADDATAELLEAIAPLVEIQALMIVAVSRPDHEEAGARLVSFADEYLRMRHTAIRLAPLDQRETLVLGRRLLQTEELPAELSRSLVEKSAGNPFYVEELVRAYVQSGDTATVARDSASGVDELILARVRALDTSARTTLETAAIVGLRVPKRVLADMIGNSVVLDAALDVLDQAELLERQDSRQTSSRRLALLRKEATYVFRHALGRDAVLASLAPDQRRELHLRCARSIEALFADRLHEYYGVLAYQYSGAERLAEAQHYLSLAGEMAAKCAASTDALRFFRDAYATYKQLPGSSADVAVEARLERNIALALLNTGGLHESIEHFNAALRLNGQWVPQSTIALAAKGALDMVSILSRLYTNRLGRATARADVRERQVFELLYNRCRVQNIVDDKRRAVDNLAAIVHLGHLNPQEIENSAGIFASAGAFFSFAGISFDPGHRFLALARNAADPGDDKDAFLYRSMAFVVNYLQGNWGDEHQIDDELLERGLRYGLFWDADVYLGLFCQRNSYQGRFALASEQIEKLEFLCDSYGYEFARSNVHAETATLLLAQRQLGAALEAEQRWYDQRNEESLHLLALGLRARAQVLDDRLEDAAASLQTADDLLKRSGARMFPYYAGFYHTARLALATARIEQATDDGRSVTSADARHARKLVRRACANARSCARDRGDTLRLAGRLEWALGNKTAALSQWAIAREECERLGALPDLGRTLADMGKALEEADDEWRAKAGIPPDECRTRAIELFKQLDCTWDLEQMGDDVRRKRRVA